MPASKCERRRLGTYNLTGVGKVCFLFCANDTILDNLSPSLAIRAAMSAAGTRFRAKSCSILDVLCLLTTAPSIRCIDLVTQAALSVAHLDRISLKQPINLQKIDRRNSLCVFQMNP